MDTKKTALLAGSKTIRQNLTEYLSRRYELTEAENCTRAHAQALENLSSLNMLFIGISSSYREEKKLLDLLFRDGVTNKIPVVVFTDSPDPSTEKRVYSLGAADYITMPFDTELTDIKLNSLSARSIYWSELENKSMTLMREAMENHQHTIDFLASVIEARNLENGEHVGRVKNYTKVLAQQIMHDYPELGLDAEQVYLITAASAVHDIGKIMIRDDVLLKPDRLTPEETEYMKTHTVHGCILLNKMKDVLFDDFYKVSYDICRYHHERDDGSGYPDRLRGEEIPLSARIVSVADCYDALTARRAYKDPFPPDTAFDMIINGECGAFDKRILASFKRCKARLKKCTRQ